MNSVHLVWLLLWLRELITLLGSLREENVRSHFRLTTYLWLITFLGSVLVVNVENHCLLIIHVRLCKDENVAQNVHERNRKHRIRINEYFCYVINFYYCRVIKCTWMTKCNPKNTNESKTKTKQFILLHHNRCLGFITCPHSSYAQQNQILN